MLPSLKELSSRTGERVYAKFKNFMSFEEYDQLFQKYFASLFLVIYSLELGR